jgi:hypothetical protein
MTIETGIIFFIILWCLVIAILSLVSGWYQLSKKYPCPADLQIIHDCGLTSLTLGIPYFPVSFSNCVFVRIANEGIIISILFLFRLLCPPILIPWNEVESVQRIRYMFMNSTLLNIKNNKRRFRFFWSAGDTLFEMCKQKGVKINA